MILRTGLLVEISGYHPGKAHLQWRNRAEERSQQGRNTRRGTAHHLTACSGKIQLRKCNSNGYIR